MRPFPQHHVEDLCPPTRGEQIGVDPMAGKGLERKWAHEFLGGIGHYRADLCAQPLQPAQNFHRLVCGNASANSQQNPFLL